MIAGGTVSHYRVLKLLGAGGMGEVYQAEDTRLKRLVALKFLPLALVQDRDAKERLVHEAQAASALDHPNICTIHEIDETSDGRLFLAMAYYEGETLKDRIARGPLAVDDALDVGTQIARAVMAAHESGIVHRDIKPANVIITPKREVKLLDFGIAKLSGQTALTRTGTTLGTVAYMAPEQIMGRGADERSDIWSLGVVLYEMIAGRRPFVGDHEVAVLRAIADTSPPPLQSLRPDIPTKVQPIIDKALQKEAQARYGSAREFVHDIEALRAPTVAVTAGQTSVAAPARATSRRGRLAVAAAILVALGLGGWFLYRQVQIRSAKQTLRRAGELAQKEANAEAFFVLRSVERQLGRDPDFVKIRDSLFVLPQSIRTDPPGADVYAKPYANSNGEWEYLGRSPLDIALPMAQVRVRIAKPGFVVVEGVTAGGVPLPPFSLARNGALPAGMVKVPGGEVPIATGGTVVIPEFLIDRFEVTNRDFKKFVDAGGYRQREYWLEPFIKDGRTLSWDDAMTEFRDATGRPGPSTWELSAYPDGQDDYPVHGVSWYEAAAFARLAGKALPTVHHWRQAAGLGIFSDILELSNFGGKGPARVGEFRGLGPYGTYDMAGNVKEWCWNAVGDKRYILGGAWNEPNYQFREPDARVPFDRSPQNSFRTIKLVGPARLPETVLQPIERLARDYGQEKPVADDVFRAYTVLFRYDRSDLKPVVESVDDGSPAWRVERITYAAAYGNERIIAYLFLPKQATPPLQTVVYFPHSGGFELSSFEKAEMSYLGFLVKAGRALLLPMYKGMYERRMVPRPSGANANRDLAIQQIKDLARSVDYLQTRSDLDHERIAYFGTSYGAWIAPIALAVETRFKTAALWSGGLSLSPQLPEVDPLNYAPHVRTPVLMLNGRDDFTFPIDSSQVPMFRLLGTPEQDKRRVLYDGGHVFPFARVEKDTLDWLDRYLGGR
jgi:dienelactone hydrolase